MLQYAITVAKNGFYIIIAQGSEAGGHRFVFNNNENNQHIPLIGTILFVPQIVNSLKKEIKDKAISPVVVAGGINDGRGLVPALALSPRCRNWNSIFETKGTLYLPRT